MIIDWKGKIAGRPWTRTISEGITQLFTRVLGTTVVVPASPRTLSYLARVDTSPSYSARVDTTFAYLASES